MSTAKATNNHRFQAEIDANRKSSLQLVRSNGDIHADWKYVVRHRKKGADLWATDSDSDDIVVNTENKTITINYPEDRFPEGRYYHLLYADTVEASSKMQLGGEEALNVVDF